VTVPLACSWFHCIRSVYNLGLLHTYSIPCYHPPVPLYVSLIIIFMTEKDSETLENLNCKYLYCLFSYFSNVLYINVPTWSSFAALVTFHCRKVFNSCTLQQNGPFLMLLKMGVAPMHQLLQRRVTCVYRRIILD